LNKKFLMIAIALSINAAKADSIPQIINPRFEAEYNANGVADADGIFMAAATRCGLPSAPFDAHLDRYIKDHSCLFSQRTFAVTHGNGREAP